MDAETVAVRLSVFDSINPRVATSKAREISACLFDAFSAKLTRDCRAFSSKTSSPEDHTECGITIIPSRSRTEVTSDKKVGR